MNAKLLFMLLGSGLGAGGFVILWGLIQLRTGRE